MALSDWLATFGAVFGRGPKSQQKAEDNRTAFPTASGVTVTEDQALMFPAVLAAVRNISEDVAATPLHVFAKTSSGRSRAFWHPLYPVLHDRPNPCMTPIDFWGALVYSAIMYPSGFAYIERGMVTSPNGVKRERGVVALWPIRADRMVVALEAGVLKYAYVEPDGSVTPFSQDEILPLRGFSREGLYGMGVLRFGSEAIGSALAGQTYGATYFGNGTTFGGVLQIPAGLTLSEKAKENLRRSFTENKGADRAFKARILEDGITWTPSGASVGDSQLLEQQTWSVQQVCRLTRETPDQLADLSRATYSNIEQQSINRLTKTLRPWFIRIEQAVNAFVLTDADRAKGYYAEHTTEALMVGDTKATYEALGIALDKGFMCRDEVRERLNLNSIAGGAGKAFLVQSAQTTLDLVVAGANVGDPLIKAVTPEPDDPEDDIEDDPQDIEETPAD